jgi:ABC-type lipoprotein release transport system permease subunit
MSTTPERSRFRSLISKLLVFTIVGGLVAVLVGGMVVMNLQTELEHRERVEKMHELQREWKDLKAKADKPKN